MLGLALFAIYFAQKSRFLLCAIFFSLSLLFKQMALYYAPVFFFFLLGQSFAHRSISLLIKISIVTLMTFVLVLLPFCNFDNIDTLASVFRRVFPLDRGLFEGKVANFWCASSVIWKIRNYFDPKDLFSLR